MRHKGIILSLLLFAFAENLMAQTEPVRVESPMVTEKDFAWYVKQKEAWKAQTLKEPKNEAAWLNYYNAARNMNWYQQEFNQQEDSTARQVVCEMEAVIPESYIFNFCAYREAVEDKDYGDANKYAEAALAKLPSEMQLIDYDNWLRYLAMQGDDTRMRSLAKRYFDSGIYSENLLRYNYNELQGMEKGGICIVDGDVVVIPKWLIQEGMGMHKDKIIVCASFLSVKAYREWLFSKLGIQLPVLKEATCAENDELNERTLLQAIIDKYESKVYFSSAIAGKIYEPWEHNLYNEGLLLKYSRKPYDNIAVKRRNVEERYMMEYLLVPFRPDWITGQRLTANYAVVLMDLLAYYHTHDKQRYEWLMKLLVSGVTNTSLSEEHKQIILDVLATN